MNVPVHWFVPPRERPLSGTPNGLLGVPYSGEVIAGRARRDSNSCPPNS